MKTTTPTHLQHEFDCIVVGAGIEGSSTAYTLAKNNKNVLLLEQFCLPHTRGSSHGQSRVTRFAYFEDHYLKMMSENFRCWDVLEKEVGKELYVKCGMLQIEHRSGKQFGRIRDLMRQKKLDFYDISSTEACRKWPCLKFNTDFNMFVDENAGVLRADRCLRAFQEMFVKFGGILKDNEQVISILPGKHVSVVTSTNKYTAKSIVITPGAWAAKILRPLGVDIPLKVVRINVCYWRVKSRNKLNDMPTFADTSNGCIYGLPSLEYPGMMKICFHGSDVEIDPDYRDVDNGDTPQKDVELLTKYVKEHFEGVESKPCIIETCMYTNTATDDPILDVHPQYPNIVIGCGFSGHGFKLAPVIGQILSQLALQQEPEFDISHNKLSCFLRNKSRL
ncbi:peroxisomal sarcosine oxidase-like [Anneissia japonica]|uniref:peroxisomal sarcosine oxidase-like n=1 Tax=Anneissia japonica TaxID=1529436 RepID=UPI0014258CEC|nr:peroxisomal sarcosine oxidase-like [Anneissia japonica]